MEGFYDTNIIIDWLNGRSAAVAELASVSRYRISRIVWAEVLAGEPSASRVRVEHLLQPFEIVEVDAAVAARAADIRHRTRMKLMDALIYATAQRAGAVLVTRNTKDFPAGMPGIHIPYTI